MKKRKKIRKRKRTIRRKKAVRRRKPVKKARVRKHKKTVKKHKKITRRKIRRHVKHRVRRHKKSRPKVYIGKGILEQLFESQVRVKLMKFFFRNANNLFQLKDIFKMLRTSQSVVRQEIKKLEKSGLIKKRERRKKEFFTSIPLSIF